VVIAGQDCKANPEVPFTLLRLDEALKRFWKYYFNVAYLMLL